MLQNHFWKNASNIGKTHLSSSDKNQNKTYKNLKEFKDRLYKFDRKRVYKSEVSNRLGI